MVSGSGSNIKIAEYLAAGCAVVTTRFGARGFEAVHHLMTIVESGELLDAAEEIVSDVRGHDERSRAARAAVAQHYDWPALTRDLDAALNLA